jgi:hypothetical protein
MYRARVVSEVSSYKLLLLISLQGYARCTAPPSNLDQKATRRCHEHTDLLVAEWELGVLWDEYGIVGDIVVIIYSSSHLCISFYIFSALISLFDGPTDGAKGIAHGYQCTGLHP